MKLVTLAAMGALASFVPASGAAPEQAKQQAYHDHNMLGASDRAAAPIRAAGARMR
jgi:hypothetical protein